MYTQCPSCLSLFQVSAQNLRVAMGMVRCTHCATVFNALASLKDEGEIVVSESESLGVQLPTRDFGDSVLIDPAFLAKHLIYRDALTTTRSLLPPVLAKPLISGETAKDISESLEIVTSDAAPPTLEVVLSAAASRGAAFGNLMLMLLGETLSLALRNLTRHRRRSAIAIGGIGVGIAALIIAGGFAEWMVWADGESTIHSRLGHIQVVKKGFYEKGVADPFAYLIADGTVNIKALGSLPHVTTVTPRLNFSGLLSKEDTTLSFLGEGVAPETEAELAKEVFVHAGQPLTSKDPHGIILGKGLAASLGANVGDAVVLLTNDKNGRVSAVDAKVRGLFHTVVKAYDDVALRAPIELARKLLKVDGSHQLIVLLDNTERTDEVLGVLRGLISERNASLQLVPWHELADFYKALVALFSAQTNFVMGIIAIIIVMSISNTLIMSVMERTAEIGTLMAIGYRGGKIMQLFVTEGFVIGLLGGLAGMLLGIGGAELISYFGIPMPPAPGMESGFLAHIRVTPHLTVSAFLIAVLSAVIASLYPAWKASRLEIVDALRRAR